MENLLRSNKIVKRVNAEVDSKLEYFAKKARVEDRQNIYEINEQFFQQKWVPHSPQFISRY